jgi:hypothetical protein
MQQFAYLFVGWGGGGDGGGWGGFHLGAGPDNSFFSRDAKVPDPPEGQRWKATQYDNKVCYVIIDGFL